MAPDQGADQTSDAQVKLKRVWTQDPRTIHALAPQALTLTLDVEGTLPRGATVQVRFARGELGQIELPAQQTLTVSPPASTSVRGLVSLSVRYGEQEIELEGGLLYGLDVADHPLLRDGAQAQPLPGITSADEVYPIDEDRFFVVQRGRLPSANPTRLSRQEDDLYVMFKRVEGQLKPSGALSRRRAKHLRTWALTIGRDLELVLLEENAAGDATLTRLRVVEDVIVELIEDFKLAVPSADVTLLDLSAVDGQLVALTRSQTGARQELRLVELSTGKTHRVTGVEADTARLVDVSSIPGAAQTPLGGAAVAGWVKVSDDDLYDLRLITHAAIEGGQHTLTLLSRQPKPARGPWWLPGSPLLATHQTLGQSRQPVTTLVYSAAQGRSFHMGELRQRAGGPPEYQERLSSPPTLTQTRYARRYGNPRPCRVQGQATPCPIVRLSALTYDTAVHDLYDERLLSDDAIRWRLEAARSPSGGHHDLELWTDGTWAMNSHGLQSSAGPKAPVVVSRRERAPGQLELVEVSGAKALTYTVARDAQALIDAQGQISAGQHNLARAALLRAGADTAHVLIEATPVQASSQQRAACCFTIVLAINNTKKKDPPRLTTSEGAQLSLTAQLAVLGQTRDEDAVALLVDHTSRDGERTPALLVLQGSKLAQLKEDEPILNAGSLLLLPKGFIVEQLVGHGDQLTLLGAKGAPAPGTRYRPSVFTVKLQSAGVHQVTPIEALSAAQIAQDLGGARHKQLMLTMSAWASPGQPPEPILIALTQPEAPPYALGWPPRPLSGPLTPGLPASTGLFHARPIWRDDQLLMLGVDHDAQRLVQLRVNAGQPERLPLPGSEALQGLLELGDDHEELEQMIAQLCSDGPDCSDEYYTGDYLIDSLMARAAQVDLNQDGQPDLLLSSALEPQRRSYDVVLLAQPDGGYALAPGAKVHGAQPISRAADASPGPALVRALKR